MSQDKPRTRKTRKKVKTAEEAAEILRQHTRVATIEDLIPSGETEKWIEVANPNDPNEILRLKIKKILMEDLAAIGKYAGEDPNETIIATLKRAIIEPRINLGTVKGMEPAFAVKICEHVMEFSNLRAEDIEAAKNLPKRGKGSESGI